MIPAPILNPLLKIMGSQRANALSLSKGGWEGWLQCELWAELSIQDGITAERELSYPTPNHALRCDLVTTLPGGDHCWIEIKAYGAFRQGDENAFLDAIAIDVHKLGHIKPAGVSGLSLVVVPNAIASSFDGAIAQRGWPNFNKTVYQYVTLYDMNS